MKIVYVEDVIEFVSSFFWYLLYCFECYWVIFFFILVVDVNFVLLKVVEIFEVKYVVCLKWVMGGLMGVFKMGIMVVLYGFEFYVNFKVFWVLYVFVVVVISFNVFFGSLWIFLSISDVFFFSSFFDIYLLSECFRNGYEIGFCLVFLGFLICLLVYN